MLEWSDNSTSILQISPHFSREPLLKGVVNRRLKEEVTQMRKWMTGVLALAGSAFLAAPSAMAQSEFGKPTLRGWFGWEDQYSYYTSPTDPNYNYTPPRTRVYRYRTVRPGGMSYFSPPRGGTVETEVEVGPGPGDCGTFFYWSEAEGRCVDARLR